MSQSDTLRTYLNEVGKYPLLTTSQEIELSRRVQRWVHLRDEKRELTKAEQREMKSGIRAREQLVKCNLRLVVHISRRFAPRIRTSGMDHMDLIQEGAVGLQRAAELFDGTKGYKFSTYAYWWIRQSMTRSIEMQDRVVRIPTNALEKVNRAFKVQSQYIQAHGHAPTIEQIAEIMEVNAKDLRMVIERSTVHTSLDGLATEEGSPLLDLLSDYEDLYENVDHKERYEDFEVAYEQLGEFDKKIISKYYGLHGEDSRALVTIAEEHGVSRERVRQRRDRALRKISYHMQRTPAFKNFSTTKAMLQLPLIP